MDCMLNVRDKIEKIFLTNSHKLIYSIFIFQLFSPSLYRPPERFPLIISIHQLLILVIYVGIIGSLII